MSQIQTLRAFPEQEFVRLGASPPLVDAMRRMWIVTETLASAAGLADDDLVAVYGETIGRLGGLGERVDALQESAVQSGGDLEVADLEVSGDADVAGTFTGQAMQAASLTVTGAASVGGTLSAHGRLRINDDTPNFFDFFHDGVNFIHRYTGSGQVLYNQNSGTARDFVWFATGGTGAQWRMTSTFFGPQVNGGGDIGEAARRVATVYANALDLSDRLLEVSSFEVNNNSVFTIDIGRNVFGGFLFLATNNNSEGAEIFHFRGAPPPGISQLIGNANFQAAPGVNLTGATGGAGLTRVSAQSGGLLQVQNRVGVPITYCALVLYI